MRLKELPKGHCFKFFTEMGVPATVGIRTTSMDEKRIAVFPIEKFFIMNADAMITPICQIEEFQSGIENLEISDHVSEMEPGTVVWTQLPFGFVQYIIVTDLVLKNDETETIGILVGALGQPVAVDVDLPVGDLGYVGQYHTVVETNRECPNCGYQTLTPYNDEKIPRTTIIYRCLTCKCKIEVMWDDLTVKEATSEDNTI